MLPKNKIKKKGGKEINWKAEAFVILGTCNTLSKKKISTN
jgi:hypothetical protein